MNATTKATTYSGYYKAESSCGTESGHEIAKEFVEIIKEVAERAPIETDYASTGCGSCYSTDAPAAVFWVAQGSAKETVSVKYDSEDDEFTREDLGELIVEVAEENGVDVSWNGDTNACVVLGVEDKYENLDAGTRVKKTRWAEKTGTVIPDDPYETTCGDGWNLVQFDGEESPTKIRTTSLEVLEE